MPAGRPVRPSRRKYSTRQTVKRCPLDQCRHPFWDHIVERVAAPGGSAVVCEKCECKGTFLDAAA